jgi:hypothetical protein
MYPHPRGVCNRDKQKGLEYTLLRQGFGGQAELGSVYGKRERKCVDATMATLWRAACGRRFVGIMAQGSRLVVRCQ